MARPRSAEVTVPTMCAVSAPRKSADPAPPAPRKATSHRKLGAAPAAAEEIPTIAAPAATTARSPNRSIARPTMKSASSRVAAKAPNRTPIPASPTPKRFANNGNVGTMSP